MLSARFAPLFRSLIRKPLAFSIIALIALFVTGHLSAQNTAKKPSTAKPSTAKRAAPKKATVAKPKINAQGDIVGTPWTGQAGIKESISQIMERDRLAGPRIPDADEAEADKVPIDRSGLPQNPDSPNVSQWPPRDSNVPIAQPLIPQTLGTSFTAVTLSESNFFPPDSMGAVGPTQILVGVNGRIRTFNKSTGAADGVLNATMDSFFGSVRSGISTSDPRVRYDRLAGRWFVIMINVSTPNRVLLAVSDGGILTQSTVWTFFFFQQDLVSPAGDTGCLADYPSLGIDANALYIGVNQFCGSPLTFSNTTAFVIRKSSVLGGGPIVVTAFRNLIGAGGGPLTPQGVDNFDPAATQGYIIGTDANFFGLLVMRRVSNPGGTPTLSGNISITVPATANPIKVNHQGNTGGSNGQLDAIDDRLHMGVIRNGRLWTVQNIGVDNNGVSNGGGVTRTASRWYEISNLDTATPTLVQSGTLFTPSATNNFNERNYWMPSVMVSGQGHMALGSSTAGTNEFANGATAGRLVSDPLGTLGAPTMLTNSTTAYNPPGNPGGSFGRRWGDYSFTSLDPCDDMTMWTIQEFCNATNSYGVRVVKLLAPPPATPTSSNPPNVPGGQASVNVTITGAQVAGSGFHDPGPGFDCRISATVSGGVVVNTVTYNSPTSVTLNISTVSAPQGAKSVTITNPDGQSITAANIITVGEGGACTYAIDPTSNSFAAAGGTGIVNVTAGAGCNWIAVSNAAWINIASGNSGTGDGTVNYSVANNPTDVTRIGTMTIAGQTFTVTQDGIPCVFSINPTSKSFSDNGGTGSVTVTTGADCDWEATSNAPWLIINSGHSGTGSGPVNYTVIPNPNTSPRTGTMTIAGHTFTVNQAATCVTSISPTSRTFSSISSFSTVTVRTQNSGCAWTAVSSSSWITIISNATQTGSTKIQYHVASNSGTCRVGRIITGGLVHTVIQTGSAGGSCCLFSISPTSQNFAASGGTNNVTVSAPNGCDWTAVSNTSWINITSGSSGSGNGTVNYSVAANPNPSPRTGTMTIAGENFTVTQDPAVVGCTFSISPTSENFAAGGGSNSVTVTAPNGCNWTATSNAPWINITSGSSGSGNGTVNYSVAANPNPSPRTGTMTIAGQTFTVNQNPAPCTFNINPTSQNFAAGGGSNSVTVTALNGCNWTATSNAPWINITSGSSGSGNGTVNYSVAVNPDTNPRTGTMTIAGHTFTVTQDPNVPQTCTFSINPTSQIIPGVGGNGSVAVTTQSGCNWTATSNASWINITSGSSGSGNGTVNYSVAANPGASPRTGTMTIAGKTFTINQQVTCVTSISPTSRTFSPFGGYSSVTVRAQNNGCVWTAVSDSSWLTIISNASGTGSTKVQYHIESNSGTCRVGTINIGGFIHTVTQSGSAGSCP